uniref:BED-type domain-containing protein n=1 Tax=Meloidogyne hapla TaxID=6305 RepID=A0A1I8BH85_MELHA
MSDIWKHFNKLSQEEAICKICSKKLKRKDGNTKGLWRHLESCHSSEFNVLKFSDSESSSNTQLLDDDETDMSDESVTRCIRIPYFKTIILYFPDDIWKPKSPGNLSNISADSQENQANRIQLQLAALRAIGRPPPNIDIFKWWRENGQQFPDLLPLARIVHSIPSTSISSERLFSKAWIIFGNTLRNRISGDMVEKILFVKANMDKLLMGPQIEQELDENESEEEEDLQDIE